MPLLGKLARTIWFCLALIGLAMVLITFTPLVPWYARVLAQPWDDAKGEVLIVLGGGTIDGRTLAPGSYWRCVYADRTWRLGGFREVVVTGTEVAPLMRDYLVSRGIPASAIRVENASTSTRENALFTRNLLDGTPGRKVLLTSDYHMFRAKRVFTKAGLDVRTRPFPDALKSSSHYLGRFDGFTAEATETAKIVYYWLRGWI